MAFVIDLKAKTRLRRCSSALASALDTLRESYREERYGNDMVGYDRSGTSVETLTCASRLSISNYGGAGNVSDLGRSIKMT